MSASEFGKWLNEKIQKGNYEKKVFLPKKGDVLLWHAALVHEGTPINNAQLTRKSLVTHYTSINRMPETHLMRDIQGNIQEFSHNNGSVVKHRWIDYSRQINKL
jgi:phytanoyl-CoA hydroxylase